MRVVAQKYKEDKTLERLLRDYVAQEVYHQATPTVSECLGEPKFSMLSFYATRNICMNCNGGACDTQIQMVQDSMEHGEGSSHKVKGRFC